LAVVTHPTIGAATAAVPVHAQGRPAAHARPGSGAQRAVFDELMEEQMRSGDDATVVAKVVVAAATDPKPNLSYPAGSIAARVSMLRRMVPARAFDKSVRKLNRMTRWRHRAGNMCGSCLSENRIHGIEHEPEHWPLLMSGLLRPW
jgi:hypothetical protein